MQTKKNEKETKKDNQSPDPNRKSELEVTAEASALSQQASSTAPSDREERQSAEESPEQIIADLQKERSDLFERLVRKQAELENYRKRVEREKGEWYHEGISDLVKEILPVLDACERALASFKEIKNPEDAVENYRAGFELLCKQLQGILKRFGVSSIETIGSPFDPYFHEAVARVESTDFDDNEVIEEMQKGYLYREKLLRPSQVKVAVKPVPTQSS